MVSKEEVKDLDNLCLRDYIYDCCKYKNNGRDHSFMKEVRDGTCNNIPSRYRQIRKKTKTHMPM